MLRVTYRIFSDLAGPFLKLWLIVRAKHGKEDPQRLSERFGLASLPRPAGRLVWIHAASVGESLSVLPLITAIIDQGWCVVLTTSTMTSIDVIKDRLPVGAVHQFAPLDRHAWIKSFLNHWRPELVLWTESELWPNMLTMIAERNICFVLINARISDRAFRRWRRWPSFASHLISAFSMILAQSKDDVRRFIDLGGQRVQRAGNLKFDAKELPIHTANLSALRAQIGQRPVWLTASIHPDEHIAILEAHQRIIGNHPDLLTIIVPRHPARAEEMAALILKEGFTVARRSEEELVHKQTSFYFADTIGEMGLFYALSDIVFIGKTLAVGGGQNPLEPAQSGCALLFGPDMGNFREIASELLNSGAAIKINDAITLGEAVNRLLENSIERKLMIKTSKQAVARHRGALTETLEYLRPFLKQSEP